VAKNPNGKPLTNAEINQKIAVSVQPFNGKMTVANAQQQTALPIWIYIVGGVLLLAIIVLFILYLRSRRKDEEEEFINEEVVFEIPDLPEEQDSEATIKRKQLEKLAKEKPDDFAKLLRSWIAED
jgi:flagellar M-ring protein FliF